MRSFNTNFRTFLWAFALALAVWVAAVTASDPDQVHPLGSSVPLEVIGQSSDMVLSTDFPRQVTVTLRAPASVWDRINSNPSSVRAILDISGLSDGEHQVIVQVQVSERPVRIVSVNPPQVNLTLEPLSTRTLPVELTQAGQPAVGYQAGDATVDPLSVVVAGAKSAVDRVTRARVAVSLDGARETVDESFPVQVLDANGSVVSGLSISPQSIHVVLPVGQQGGYRDLAVKVVVRGQVASG
ncbi:MAG TPA: CdaR family protein, partial [Anaerolineales bacterium]